MPNVVKARSAAPSRKSAPNVKALQTLLKSMEREVAKLGKELEKLQQKVVQEPKPKQSKRAGTVSAERASKKAKKVAVSGTAAKLKRHRHT